MAPNQETPILNGHATSKGDVNGQKHINGHSNGTAKAGGHDDAPDLASRLRVERSEKAFSSRAVSLIDLSAGTLFARIDTATPTATKAYSSVQVGENAHIELNSELLYCNHSCDPSLIFDMSKFEVRVEPGKAGGVKKGEPLTFWYPSSEWDMAQPFDCNCGSEKCKGKISGAKDMDEKVLREYWLNPHIERMLDARNAEKTGQNGNHVVNGSV